VRGISPFYQNNATADLDNDVNCGERILPLHELFAAVGAPLTHFWHDEPLASSGLTPEPIQEELAQPREIGHSCPSLLFHLSIEGSFH